MARLEDRLPENAPGDFYVDASCIDCDTCRHVAPGVFARSAGEQSFVARQPSGPDEALRAAMALVACPTASIGSEKKTLARAAAAAFPEPIDGGVHYCGYASEGSFGASSYWVRRERGNLLVDSPRAARPLLARLVELGGARPMFLTHADDVADHERFREALGCERVMMAADARSSGTVGVERKLEGLDPIRLEDDLLVIPLPGHTRGSAALLLGDVYLFTGDHLWWSAERGALHASREVCWYSWEEQTRSMERLLDHRFEHVLPGHGRRWRAPSAAAMRAEVERVWRAMRA